MTQKRQRPARAAGKANGNGDTRVVLDGIRRLERGLRLAARQVEAKTGLSAAQLFVLEHLAEMDSASIADLAQRTFTDRSSVSVAVERLVSADLVTRKASEGDRRRSDVRITAEGRAVLRKAPKAPTDLLLAALGRLPTERVRVLGRSLLQLNRLLGFEDAPLLFSDRR